jgi:methylamine dehydrogenase accessory protein MauD
MSVIAAGLAALRAALAAVFAVAGAAKLADRAGSRQAAVDFGAPPALAPALGTLLPVAELATAAALLPVSTARWGALGALVLLALFTAAIAIAVARGSAAPCHCFGQLSSAPVGPGTLIRNGVLLAAAAFLTVRGWNDPGPSLAAVAAFAATPRGLADTAAAGAVLFAAALILLMLAILRQQGRILLRLEAVEQWVAGGQAGAMMPAVPAPAGLPVGSPAPPFRLRDLSGAATELTHLLAAGKPLLLLFVHPRCGPCEALLPQIAEWQRLANGALTIPLVSQGSSRENRAMAAQHGIAGILRQRASEVGEAYQAHGTPSAVLVQADGTIGSQVASGAEAIRALAESLLGPSPNGRGSVIPLAAAAPRRGDPAPAFTLPDLRGAPVRLEDTHGVERLLVAWNPSCGFCAQLLEPLKAWEAGTRPAEMRMIVVARGDAREMAAAGFRSTVLLDAEGRVTQAYGMSGTPMALLVDAEGRIASDLAAGGDAILSMVRARAAHHRAEPVPAPR